MRAQVRSCVFAPILAFAAAIVAASSPLPAKPSKYATDRAGVVPAARLAALNERLAAFDRETSNQILVVVDRRLPADTTLEELGVAALRAWGVGQKGRDNGVIFFVFVDERAMRIEVGYGLEGAIPDIAARRITDGVVKPFFKRNDYAGGIEAGANALMSAARREGFKGAGAARPRPQPRPAMKAPPPRPAPGISFAAFWALVGRTLAIGAAIAAVFMVAFRFVSRRSVREEAVVYARTFMAAWGSGTAVAAALQGHWIFAGIAFVVGLLFVIEYQPSGDGTSSGSYSSYDSSSSSSYSSPSYESPSSSSESSSSSSNFSGGGGDGGGGGSSDRW